MYIEREYRGSAYGAILIKQAVVDTKKGSFQTLYLCTDHTGYYEKYGFLYLGIECHPWGETSCIY